MISIDIDKLQPKNLAFLLHDQCNLKCSYCWEHYDNKHWDKKLSFAEFVQIIDFFTENFWVQNLYNTLPEIKLGGGEAFFYANELMLMIDYIISLRNIIPVPMIILQTNGTCIPDVFFEKYCNENIDLGLSLDGPKDLHDLQRDNSFDKIPIAKIQKYFPKTKVYITINKENIYRIPEAIDFVDNLGFKRRQVTINRYDTCSQEEILFLQSLDSKCQINYSQKKKEDNFDGLIDILQTIIINPYGNFWICNHPPVNMPDGWGACGNYKTGLDMNIYKEFLFNFWEKRKEELTYDNR